MSLRQVLDPIADIFADLEVPYRIGGSVASSEFGRPRSTNDVDLVADLRDHHVDELAERAEPLYYADVLVIRDAVQRRDAFNLVHLGTFIKVDVFVLGKSAFEQSAFERCIVRELGEGADVRPFPFTTPEDMVVQKLRWFRKGGGVSENQWNDILGLLQRGGLDSDYIVHWVNELGLRAEYDRAVAAAVL